MVIQAVLAGLGSALLPEILIADELKSSRLVSPISTRVRTAEAYFLVQPDGSTGRDSATLFTSWILDEIGVSAPLSTSSSRHGVRTDWSGRLMPDR